MGIRARDKIQGRAHCENAYNTCNSTIYSSSVVTDHFFRVCVYEMHFKEFAAKEKFEIVKSRGEAAPIKTAKEPEKTIGNGNG